MSVFPRIPIAELVVEGRVRASAFANQTVWNLNLDQIEPGSGRIIEKLMVKAADLGPSTYPFEAGTLLYSKLRPYLNKVVVADSDGFATTELVPLRCNPEKVIPAYLAYFLRSPEFLGFATNVVAGAKMPRMVMSDFWRYEVPLPPLPEQRRIAAILDQAEALRAKRRAALAKLDTLAQSIFIEMFGDTRVNPKNWPQRSFSAVCETRLGRMLDQKRETGAFSRPYLRNANVQWFSLDLSDVYEMDFAPEERQTYLLQEGDLLICEGGQPGRCAIWRSELPECYFQKALHRGRPKKGVANSEYLAWLLWFMVQNGQLGDHVTSATIAHLTGEKLKAMSILLPPFKLQEEFAARLGAVNRIADSLRNSATQLNHLFGSIQHKAFRGDL